MEIIYQDFIVNYANIHGLPSIITRPVSDSYIGLYQLYDSNLDIDSEHNISCWSFLRVWKKYVHEIKFLSPQSDLCTLCKAMRFNSQFWN